jgi:hypothetical protein
MNSSLTYDNRIGKGPGELASDDMHITVFFSEVHTSAENLRRSL